MSIESLADLDGITRVGQVVARALRAMELHASAGVTTRDLDEVGAGVLKEHGARSAPQLIYGCPAWNLISVNDEVVHGLPGPRRLQDGDVVKLDVTAELDGYIADAAVTVVVPGGSDVGRRLRQCAIEAFDAGLAAARTGRLVSDIGHAVHCKVAAGGFSVLRPLMGHGVGRAIHETPAVPNFRDPFQRDRLTDGLVLTIEPLISEKPTGLAEDRDGWTLRTRNGCLAAHHEHTVIIMNGAATVVTRVN